MLYIKGVQKTILLTGASGFLGYHIMKHAQSRYRIVGTYFRHKPEIAKHDLVQINLIETARLQQLIKKVQPQFILHCAALTKVSFCERHPAQSYHVNVHSTKILSELAQAVGIPLLYVSTDSVFDGKTAPYRETALPKPISRYGQQKRSAEEIVTVSSPQNWVCRLALLFGLGNSYHDNFLKQWIRALQNGSKIYATADEYRNPLSAKIVAAYLFQLINLISADVEIEGKNYLHIAGDERISFYEFARLIAEVYQINPTNIIASRREDAKTPKAEDSCLETSKARKIFKWSIPSLKEQLSTLRC